MKLVFKLKPFAKAVLGGYRSRVACLFAFVANICLCNAIATDVRFAQGNYSIDDGLVTMTMDNIENYNTDSGSSTLRMELWAFTSPYTGAAGATGYEIAVSENITALGPGEFFQQDLTENALYNAPPDGAYYVSLFLTEYTGTSSADNGFQVDDYANFTDTLKVATPITLTGAFFSVPSAVFVGDGYYYDPDLQYIYPLGDGVVYLSSLDRYYYIDPGTSFSTGTFIYDFYRASWIYAASGSWPYVYYFKRCWVG